MSDDGMMTREIGNLRFLIEQQLQLIEELDRRGMDGRSAQDLLRRLMRRDEELRFRLYGEDPRRVA
ncbi:MAG: hypothetical protein ACRYGP_24455 [Janthinobacterium lividum]